MAAIRLAALLGLAGSAAGQSQLFVDCQKGSDSNVGTLTSPFRTLDRARIASHGNSAPLTINVLPGECFPATTGQTVANYSVPVLALTSIDSGTEASPVTYSAYAGPGSVRLIAGAPLNPSAWVPFKGPIVQLDLAAAGLASWGFGALTSGGLGQCTNDRAELFFGGAAMTLARYPNVPFGQRPSKASFLNVGAVGPGNPAQSFTIDNPRLLTWAAEANPWLHGYWAEDWADNHVHAAGFTQPGGPGTNVTVSIDPKTPALYTVDPNARFYGENLLCELDAPGEYYVDTAKNVLYFYPPAPLASAAAYLSMAENAVALTSTAYVTIDGFSAQFARLTGIDAQNVESVTLANLDVSNQGGSGVSLYGSNNVLRNVTGSGMGCKGASVSGGDTSTLTAGNNTVVGCSFTQYARFCRTYQAGIAWGGVGNAFINNTVGDAPHTGMLGGGNDNVFRGNLFTDLTYESSDTGAWYAGRSWVARGNLIEGNTFVRIRNTIGFNLGYGSVQAIYLDDQLSQQYVVNNTVIDSDAGMLLGGGRDVYVSGNSFQNCRIGITYDNRGMNWQSASCAYNASYTGQLVQDLFNVHYTQPPYAAFYPPIVPTLQNHPCVPVNATITGNACCNCTQGFIDRTEAQAAAWFSVIAENTNVTTCS